MSLVKGETLTVTTNPAFLNKCDEKTLYMDYANLPKENISTPEVSPLNLNLTYAH